MYVLDILMPFARTGRIGAARVGAQLKDATEALGPPWARGSWTGADGQPHLCRTTVTESDRAETPPGRPAWSEVLRALSEAGCPGRTASR